MLIFVILLAISEVFVQLRWRVSMTCTYCGFDPVLYLKNIDCAVAKFKKRLDERKSDPATLLAPALQIPKRPAPRESKSDLRNEAIDHAARKKGRLISREI